MIDNRSDFLIEYLNPDSGFFFRKGQLLERGESEFQSYEVYDSPQFGKLFTLDNCFMTSEKEEFFYHENIIHIPAVTHPSPESALIIGGGDGGAAEELLKHKSIKHVVLVELDKKVIEISKKYLSSIHNGVLYDDKLEIRIEDGIKYVNIEGPAAGKKFDLIVLDLTDPVGPAIELYTAAFFKACKILLTDSGAMTLHIGPPVFAPERVAMLIKNLTDVFTIVRPYFIYTPLYGSLWGMAIASETLDPLTLSVSEVDRRLVDRKISNLKYYNGETHKAVFALPGFIKELIKL